MKKYKGNVRLIRGHNGKTGDYVGLVLTDESSRCNVIKFYFASLEDAARCLLHNQQATVEYEFNDSGVIGMLHKHKTENVPISFEAGCKSRDGKRTDAINAALAPFEVDGWEARLSDLGNMHRRTKDGFNVTFFRHVPNVSETNQEGV